MRPASSSTAPAVCVTVVTVWATCGLTGATTLPAISPVPRTVSASGAVAPGCGAGGEGAGAVPSDGALPATGAVVGDCGLVAARRGATVRRVADDRREERRVGVGA